MNPTDIQPWRARLGLAEDYPLSCATAVEQAMEQEIAELRMCLALRAAELSTPADPRQLDIFGAPA